MIRKLLLAVLALACLAVSLVLPLAVLAAEVATVGDRPASSPGAGGS